LRVTGVIFSILNNTSAREITKIMTKLICRMVKLPENCLPQNTV
jgi:hypothetical protein